MERSCAHGEHFWPDNWVSGDTCNCGAFYLIEPPHGGMKVLEADQDDEYDDDLDPTLALEMGIDRSSGGHGGTP